MSIDSKLSIGVVNLKSRRTDRLVSSFLLWAEAEGQNAKSFNLSEILKGELPSNLGLLYIPLTRDLEFIDEIPKEIPLVIDYDGALGNILIGGELLSGRKYAFRRAFPGATPWHPSIQVPYCHRPSVLEPLEPDVVILDTHQWLRPSFHLALLAIADSLYQMVDKLEKARKKKIYFYLTGGFDREQYFRVIREVETFGGGLLSFMKERLIPEAQTKEDFDSILGRCLLFVTDHGDIADQDVSQIVAMGRPVHVQSRNALIEPLGISSSLEKIFEEISTSFRPMIQAADRLRTSVREDPLSTLASLKFNSENMAVFEEMYSVTWNILIDWSKGSIDSSGWEKAIEQGPNWRNIVR